MTRNAKTILWATAIITAAIFTQVAGLSNGASFGIIAGLTGAAIGALSGNRSTGGKCAL
ncbi:MAG: hypothetical protein ABJP48_04400 [Erythrobacter sp.]